MEKIYCKEKWKEFFISDAQDVAYQRIYVSNFGRIRIKDLVNNTFKFAKISERNGFLAFTYKDTNGYPLQYTIHRAVALTFLKQKDSSHIFVIHKDLNRQNNYFKNLKFVDLDGLLKYHKDKEEFYHEGKHREILTKLSLKQVKEIKKRLNSDATYTSLVELAEEYQVSTSQISRIKLGKNWKFVDSQ